MESDQLLFADWDVTTMPIPRVFLDTLLEHLPYAAGKDLVETDELAALGLDSMGVVQLLTSLEEIFGLDLPDELVTEDTFATVGSLWLVVSEVVGPEQFADA